MPKRFGIMLLTSLAMAICGFGVFAARLLQSQGSGGGSAPNPGGIFDHLGQAFSRGQSSLAQFIILLGIFSFVFLAYLLVALLVPGLHPTDDIRAPQNLSLPLVFDSLLLLLLSLILRTGDGLTVIPPPLQFLQRSTSLGGLLMVYMVQVVALSTLALISQRKPAARVDSG